MAKILLLEDDPVLGKGLQVHLQTAGYDVTWETHLAKARISEAQANYDLLLLDVNLPDGSGFDLCRDVRKGGSRLPILMLTARTDEDSVVQGFESGANDYIRKPFSNRELLARIQAHLKEPMQREDQLRAGPVLVLLEQRKVLIDNKDMEFNRREFDIFSHLMKSPGAVLSREQLISGIDGADNILDRTIDSHFSHIRAKLKKHGVQNVSIRSVYGVGYTLELQ
jgi:two-component system OmpR family response regulator